MVERVRGSYLAIKLGSLFVTRSLQETSDEDFCRRPGENSNSIQWILGHLILSRGSMLRVLGRSEPFYADGIFNRGKPAQESSKCPGKKQMMADWEAISKKVMAALEEADEKLLATKTDFGYPVEDDTIFGGIAFLCFHESYHIGQLAYIQKMLGYKTVAG